MDLDKLDRAKEIQQKLHMLRSYIENFPAIATWDFIAELLDSDYDLYTENALCTLNLEVAALEKEFSQL